MGCETPTQTPTAWLEKDELWYNCPRKFLIDSVLDFLQEYNSCKDHISTPRPYNEQSAKFLAAVSVYESFCARFIAEKQGDSDVKS